MSKRRMERGRERLLLAAAGGGASTEVGRDETGIDRAFLKWHETRLLASSRDASEQDVIDYLVALALRRRDVAPALCRPERTAA